MDDSDRPSKMDLQRWQAALKKKAEEAKKRQQEVVETQPNLICDANEAEND